MKTLFKWHNRPNQSSAFCQFPLRWIYHCHSSKTTGKEIGKIHLFAVHIFKFCCIERAHKMSFFRRTLFLIFSIFLLQQQPLQQLAQQQLQCLQSSLTQIFLEVRCVYIKMPDNLKHYIPATLQFFQVDFSKTSSFFFIMKNPCLMSHQKDEHIAMIF